ncbi:hypothetical protein XENORESO_004299 [Xenotaenia resolanae]|uniref:Uncharacterized protein n=1 Tax=Xenotaenia resolanae TaxID=208358 RepID=A0ABV0WRE3_9TELE
MLELGCCRGFCHEVVNVCLGEMASCGCFDVVLKAVAILETGTTSAISAKVLKSGNIYPAEVMRSQQESPNEGFPDPPSTLLQCPRGSKQLINMLIHHQVVRV